MTELTGTFGIAAQNFTAYPQMPDARGLVEYGVRMEQLGFDSIWVWDHTLLGVEPNFPIIDSLTVLTAIAARTNKIKLGTGILVLPLRRRPCSKRSTRRTRGSPPRVRWPATAGSPRRR